MVLACALRLNFPAIANLYSEPFKQAAFSHLTAIVQLCPKYPNGGGNKINKIFIIKIIPS